MGRRLIHLDGQRFGRLIVEAYLGQRRRRAVWQCRCDCGATTEVRAENLVSDHSTSCGCYAREMARDRARHLRTVGDGKGRSRPNNRLVEVHGTTMHLAQAVLETGQSYDMVRKRLARGWSVPEALGLRSRGANPDEGEATGADPDVAR